MNCRCGKVLTDKMEIEYSHWINEFFCSPDCATDRYFEYMESGAVDFTQPLPEGVLVIDGFLTKDSGLTLPAPDKGDSPAPENLPTLEGDSTAEHEPTPAPCG